MKKVVISFLLAIFLLMGVSFSQNFPQLTFYNTKYETVAKLLNNGKFVNIFNEELAKIRPDGRIIKHYPFQLLGFLRPGVLEDGPYHYYVYLKDNKVVDIYNNNLVLCIKDNGFVYDGYGKLLGSVTGRIKDNWQYITIYYLFVDNQAKNVAVYKPYYPEKYDPNIILFFLNTY